MFAVMREKNVVQVSSCVCFKIENVSICLDAHGNNPVWKMLIQKTKEKITTQSSWERMKMGSRTQVNRLDLNNDKTVTRRKLEGVSIDTDKG